MMLSSNTPKAQHKATTVDDAATRKILACSECFTKVYAFILKLFYLTFLKIELQKSRVGKDLVATLHLSPR